MRASFFTAVFVFFIIHSSRSQTSYLLTDTATVHRLDAHTDIFIDPDDSVSIQSIVTPAYQRKFERSAGNLTFGYLKSVIWLKVQLKASRPQTTWYLEIPAPFLEYVDFYQEYKGA